MWGRVNGAVRSYRDLATPLITAVERLIDFVTVGTDARLRRQAFGRPNALVCHDRSTVHLRHAHDRRAPVPVAR